MKITDAIRGEHAAMRPFLRQVREDTKPGANMPAAKVQVSAQALKTMIHAHATVEEPYLLKPLKNYEPARHALDEHEELEDLLDVAVKTGSQKSLHKAVKLALGHFDEEERDVFPLAEKALGLNKLAQLGAEWARARGIRM